MLMNGKDLFVVVNEYNFVILVFNVSDYVMMKGFFEISEEKNVLMIVVIYLDEVSYIGVEVIFVICECVYKLSVFVVIYWDYGGFYE